MTKSHIAGADAESPVATPCSSSDNWDKHWEEFGAAAETGPTPKYRRRILFKLLNIDTPGESARMLEIGSGTGEFAEEFLQRYAKSRYLGLELSRTGVEMSARRVPEGSFLQRDLLQPAATEAFSDYLATHAICTEVLEHLDEPGLLLANARRYMAPGCRMVVTVPGGPMNAFYRHIGHRRHYSPDQLRELLEQAGFDVEQTYGAGFPFFNLFRLLITWRGDKLVRNVSGPPSGAVRFAGWVFDILFRLNAMRWGWQTVAVVRYKPRTHLG